MTNNLESLTGKTVELLHMPSDPDPVPVGSRGVVTSVADFDDFTIISVLWDGGARNLNLVVPPDEYRVLE